MKLDGLTLLIVVCMVAVIVWLYWMIGRNAPDDGEDYPFGMGEMPRPEQTAEQRPGAHP